MDERSRHRLYLKLEEILGPEEAGTLMDHLPPTGFADLATKDDLRVLRNELVGRMDALEARMDGLEARMEARMEGGLEGLEGRLTARMEQLGRRLVMWTSSMVLATAALAFAAGRFA